MNLMAIGRRLLTFEPGSEKNCFQGQWPVKKCLFKYVKAAVTMSSVERPQA